MRRVMILGPCGSGKSTLARHLGAALDVPVFHLDRLFHRPGWVPAPEAKFGAEVDRIAALPCWVIDGDHSGRIATGYGRVRPDAAPGRPERLDHAFLRYASTWNRARREPGLARAASFPGRSIVLRGRAEQRRFVRDGVARG